MKKKLWAVEVADSAIARASLEDAEAYVQAGKEIMIAHAKRCESEGTPNLVEGIFEDACVIEWQGTRSDHARALLENPEGQI